MNFQTLALLVAVLVVISTMRQADQPQAEAGSEIQTTVVEPDYYEVFAEPFAEISEDPACECECECDECVCNLTAAPAADNCPGGVCTPRSTSSCPGGTCAVRQPVRSTVRSTTNRVFRSSGNGPIRRVFSIFRRR